MLEAIVQVWSHKIPSPLGMGIGDFLRGTMCLYQLSKKNGFELIVDTDLHQMSFLLEKTPNRFQRGRLKVDFVPLTTLKKYLIKHRHANVLTLSTNEAFNEAGLTEDCKLFMREKVLQPNHEAKKFFLEKMRKYPSEFDIYHFRLGDEHFFNQEYRLEGMLKGIILSLKELKLERPIVLLSDSLQLRKVVAKENIPGVFCDTDDIGHIGYTISADAMANTLFEYMLLSEAKSIKTFSSYNWISGFVYYSHKIWDIPLHQIVGFGPITTKDPTKQIPFIA